MQKRPERMHAAPVRSLTKGRRSLKDIGTLKAQLRMYRENSTAEIEIDGRTMPRYEWPQEQRRIETAVRAQKDIAIAAKASGDDVARREAQSKINALQERYEKMSNAARLDLQRDRMRVAGFRAVKTETQLAISKLNRTITSDGISIKATAHVVERMKERGISVDSIVDALTKPLSSGTIKADDKGRRSKQYIGEKATAAVNPDDGSIASAWPTSTKRAKKLKEELKSNDFQISEKTSGIPP